MHSFFEKATQLDKADPLARFRDRFAGDEPMIYLDGNSLGKLPLETLRLLAREVEHNWGKRLIRSWNESWLGLQTRLSAKLAKVLGAQPDEIFIGDSTSLNLYKLAYAALQHQQGKTVILSDKMNFPTDLYILQGLINSPFTHHRLELLGDPQSLSIDYGTLQEAVDIDTALITFSHVNYKSAFMYDMERVNAIARESGALVLWDLSHAAGAVETHLNQNGTELAVGCTYKYLNGGPGAPAFLYVSQSLQKKLSNPVWSWFGHRAPFDFDLSYSPHPGIQRFGIGSPHILSLAAIEPGLELILEAGMSDLREKSLAMSRFLIEMADVVLAPLGFTLASPRVDAQRGSHVSLRHPEAQRITRAMIEPMDKDQPVVIPDFRPPDLIRLGIAPLYTRFTDIYLAVERIRQIMSTKEYERRFGEQTVP